MIKEEAYSNKFWFWLYCLSRHLQGGNNIIKLQIDYTIKEEKKKRKKKPNTTL